MFLINKLIGLSSRLGKKIDFFGKVTHRLKRKKRNMIFDVIENNSNKLDFSTFVSDSKIIKKNNCIWIFWYQGVETAPDLIKNCINSIRSNSGSRELIILDKNNISEYCILPDYIYDKLNKNIITFTHFSDILRSFLLSFHGGVWIDATIFLTKSLDDIISSGKFFTLKGNKNNSVSEGKWTGYFISSEERFYIFEQMFCFFISYWENSHKLIDYFLIDYFLKYFYKNDSEFHGLIENLPINGNDRFLLDHISAKELNIIDNKKIAYSLGVFKLSYKKQYSHKINTYSSKIMNGNLIDYLNGECSNESQ